MEQPNTDYIDQLSGNHFDFRNKMISILKMELPEELNIYANHIKTSNFREAAAMVHKLKHKISILGLEHGYAVAEEYENQLKNNTTILQSDFEKIAQSMVEFVAEL
jgi:HPt (histidine-containing phosphotransfer) domain-containing protein